jgi:hypothetical protein
MYFMLRSGWHCQLLEPDLKTALPKKLTFTDARKIVELAERGGYSMTAEGRHALEHGVANGAAGFGSC